MNNIYERLGLHYDTVCEEYGEENVMGVFLYGSQNYGINTPTSDVDTKAILIPNINKICAQEKWESKELLVDEEHCEVKDIREMRNMWFKQNMNFLEILFTKYYIVNDKYKEDWKNIKQYAEEISKIDLKKMYKSVMGQITGTLRSGISTKKIANALRLLRAIDVVGQGGKYEDAVFQYEICRSEYKEIRSSSEIKEEHIDSLENAMKLVKGQEDKFNSYDVDTYTISLINSLIEYIIEKRIIEDSKNM